MNDLQLSPSQAAAKQLSIIIVAYNSNDVLKECFDSISRHNPIGNALEVVVVDNKPDTELEQLIESVPRTFDWTYVPNASNNGFGGGNNLGVKHAHAPYVFFLNPDTVMVEDVITPTLEVLRQDANAVVGYRLTDRQGGPNYSFSYLPEYILLFPFLHLFDRLAFAWGTNHLRWVNRLTWPWGAAFSLSRDRFEQAGCFDERIFLCNEEPDLMRRLPQRRIVMLPTPIIHLEGHGRVVPVGRYAAYLDSCDYYLRKHHIRTRRFFWWLTEMKLRLKRCTGRGHDANLWEAFQTFKSKTLRP